MLPTTFLCPRCNCGACYALHRKGIDWLFTWIGLRPARCLTCERKFYARYSLDDDPVVAKEPPPPERVPGESESPARGNRHASQ